MPRRAVIWIVTVPIALAACADAGTTSFGRGNESIIGGAPHAGDPSVVFLRMSGEFGCTASIIAPRVVLTAKHCIQREEGSAELLDAPTVEIGQGPAADSGAIVARAVEILTTPGAELDAADIALLVTDRDVGLAPYDWVRDAPPAVGAHIVGIGYGQIEPEPGVGPSGTKYRGESSIAVLDPAEFTTSGPISCYGDSGGPAFLDDGRIFGVVSRGTGEWCDDQTIYTRVDAFRALVESALARAAGGAAPGADPADPGVAPAEPGPADPGAPPGADDPGDGYPGDDSSGAYPYPDPSDPWADPSAGEDPCAPYPVDTDGDGVADAWLDPAADNDGDGYPDDPWCADGGGWDCPDDGGGWDEW